MYMAAISYCHCFHSLSKSLLGRKKDNYTFIDLNINKEEDAKSCTNVTFYIVSISQVNKIQRLISTSPTSFGYQTFIIIEEEVVGCFH